MEQKILIIDDISDNILLLSKILYGTASIIFCMDSQHAFDMAREHAPDLILLDIEMPQKDGYSVIDDLKSHDETRNIPVIFVTARSDSENEELGLRLGAIDYISKPYHPAIVKARVQNHLLLRSYAQRLEKLNEQLEELANTDPLTGAYNRRHFMHALSLEQERVIRYRVHCAVLMLDIDHFKSINDTYGHEIGDLALVSFHKTVKTVLRGPDVFGRLGGEEFAVIAPETRLADGLKLAGRILEAVRGIAIDTDKGVLKFTVSIGIAQLGVGGRTEQASLAAADSALYRAKEQGRDRAETAESR